ncbi:MAG: hypothetical protein SPD11_06710 [Sphaerochaetaceae bacterium]|nr:hypothetical protein [Sphaerochaetaceae bacterium]
MARASGTNRTQVDTAILEQFRNMHAELRNLYHVCYDINSSEQELIQAVICSSLDRLDSISGYPRKRLELLTVCYGIDSYLYMHGCVPVQSWRDIYQRMNGMFWKLARAVADQDWTSGLLCEQLRLDPIGWHLPLVVGAGDFFDDTHLLFIVERFKTFASGVEPSSRRDSYLYLAGFVSRIIDRFDDFTSYVLELSGDEPSTVQCLYVADCYADNAPEKALDWLGRLAGKELSGAQQINKLRIQRTCFHTMEDFRKEETVARELFRRRYSLSDAKQLLDCVPYGRWDETVSQEVAHCFETSGIHPSGMLFISRYTDFATLNRYVLSHVDGLNEFAYSEFSHSDILPHAMNLAEQGYCVAATVLYRVLVLNILVRKLEEPFISRGCDYLIRLGSLSRWIHVWKPVGFSHSQFLRFLKKNYPEQKKFWISYDERVAGIDT